MNFINYLNKLLSSPGNKISQQVIHGSIWVFALQIINQTFKICRTIILARLLAPKDFGIFGISMLTISILETFTNMGFERALIQKKQNVGEYLDTAWTIQIFHTVFISLLLFSLAPLSARFFNEPRVILIIRYLALGVLIMGFKNIGIMYFQKEIEFHKYFACELSSSLINLLVTISAAFLLKNIWALVIGIIMGNCAYTIISYVIHPYRPKLEINWLKVNNLFSFGKWILASSIISFLALQGDDIVLGKILGVGALGLYQIAFLFSNFAATEITHVITKVMFPAYSKLQDDTAYLSRAFLGSLEFTVFLCLPASILILLFGSDFTILVLGIKWMPIVPALQILTISGLFRSITATGSPLFRAVFMPQLSAYMNSYRVLIMFIAIFPLTIKYGINGSSIAVLLSVLSTIPTWLNRSSKIIKMKRLSIISKILPIFIISFSNYFLFYFIKKLLFQINFLDMFFLSTLFITIYTGIYVFLWYKYNYGPFKILLILKQ